VNKMIEQRDVVVVGAGPIGIEMAVALEREGLSYVLLEAKQVGHTIGWWPRNTPFFSTSERLAISGVPIQNNHQSRITGEEYLTYLRAIVEQFDLDLRVYEPVVGIETLEGDRLAGAGNGNGNGNATRDETVSPYRFAVRTKPISGGTRTWNCKKIILATGDMAAPMRLDIPGEDLPHVTHYFRDPQDYFRSRLLVVGGKNSAIEAALRSWRSGAQVTLSYRRAALDEARVKPHLLPDFHAQVRAGNIAFLPSTTPRAISAGRVELSPTDEDGRPLDDAPTQVHETDFVLLATGFVASPKIFELAGVSLAGEQNAPVHDSKTMETDVPGIHVIGTAIAGTQMRYRVFIETSHVHVWRMMGQLTGKPYEGPLGTIPERSYELPFEEYQAN
jgi:thioredoxin reductase (NADPH)